MQIKSNAKETLKHPLQTHYGVLSWQGLGQSKRWQSSINCRPSLFTTVPKPATRNNHKGLVKGAQALL